MMLIHENEIGQNLFIIRVIHPQKINLQHSRPLKINGHELDLRPNNYTVDRVNS